MTKKIIVDLANERLDIYLSNALNFSRTQVKELIKKGFVTVNGKVLKPSYLVVPSDEILIDYEDSELKEELDLTPQDLNLKILYEDEYLAIIDKPKDLVVHPAKGHNSDTLINGLLFQFQNLSGDEFRPGIVHRLDKDTSGVLVIAKDDLTHRLLQELFASREVKKYYKALCCGVISEDEGIINLPIRRHDTDRKKMGVYPDGKEAITKFLVLERFNDHTFVEVELITGRTHQIRVHFAYLKKPILGDPLYGHRKVYGDQGQYLHASRIIFTHPITHQVIDISSDLPKYFSDELIKLRT